MRSGCIARWMCVVVAGLASGAWAAGQGFGVMGDSLGDEYQFETDRSSARNFVEILSTARGVNFGSFTAQSRGEPRRQGYEFNWARTDATSADVLSQGQHTGLAGQAAAGKVQIGILVVGSNDIANLVDNFDPSVLANTTSFVQSVLGNVSIAANTFLAANPDARLVIANIPDLTKTPRVAALVAAQPALGAFVQPLSDLIAGYNGQLEATFQANDRIAIADVFGMMDGLLAQGNQVAGVTLDTTTPGTDPKHLFIDDVHPGTVGQALLANLFIDTIDSQFGQSIAPLTNAEVLGIAGISTNTPAPIPLPAAAWLAIVALPALAVSMRWMKPARA